MSRTCTVCKGKHEQSKYAEGHIWHWQDAIPTKLVMYVCSDECWAALQAKFAKRESPETEVRRGVAQWLAQH